MAKIEITKTQRGFKRGEFTDAYDEKCSIQESSAGNEACIWLGVNDANPLIMSKDAIRLGLREQTFDEGDNGFVPYEIPKEVLLTTRMHLTRSQVKKLLPLLHHFVKTGELPDSETNFLISKKHSKKNGKN